MSGRGLDELISKSYEVLSQSGTLWQLVKIRYPTTSFIHFTTTGVVAFKLAQMVKKISESNSTLNESILQLEQEAGIPFEDYCFLIGFLHDYEKFKSNPKIKDVDEFANYILKSFGIPEKAWDLIKRDAKSVEAGVSELGGKHHELAVMIGHVADVLSSQDTVFGLRLLTTGNQFTARKIRQLEQLGLRLGSLFIGSHRLFTILRSEAILKLFENRGWTPLLIYKDGVVLVGTKTSGKVSLDELSKQLASEIFQEICEYVKDDIDEAIGRIRRFVGHVAEALAKELSKEHEHYAKGIRKMKSKKEHRVLANLLAKAIKGELSVGEAVERAMKETGRGIQSFQKSILPPTRRPLKNILKDKPVEEIVELVKKYVMEAEKDEVAKIARLSYFVAGWTKEEEDLVKLYKLIFREEPPREDILTIALATIVKVFQYVREGKYEELAELYERGFKSFLSGREERWKYEVDYYVSSYISGDVVEPFEPRFPKTDKRCILCRSPVFSDEPLQMDEYGKTVAGGGEVRGVQQVWTSDDIPLANKDKYVASTKEPAKYTRSICTLCKYEGIIIRKALDRRTRGVSVPFIAIYFRPAIAPEVLSFAVTSINRGVGKLIKLNKIYKKEGEDGKKTRARVELQLPDIVIPNYLGAFIIFSYKGYVSDQDGGKILKTPDISGKRDQIYYGLLLIPVLARKAGGGQFKICLSVVDLATPPAKLIEVPVAVRFVEELNGIVAYLQERSSNREFLDLYSVSYYHVMRFLEGVAIKLALWYDHSKVSKEANTVTWLVKGIGEVDELPLHIALLVPPSTGFDKAESMSLRREDLVHNRDQYRGRFLNVYEIATEFSTFISRVKTVTGVGRYV